MEKETFDGNDIEVTETETSEQQVSEETEKPPQMEKTIVDHAWRDCRNNCCSLHWNSSVFLFSLSAEYGG